MQDGSVLLGELVSFNESPYKLHIITGDTVTINPLLAKRIYLPEEINLFDKGKWTYKNGLVFNMAIGMSNEHNNFDVDLSYLYRNKFSLGVGLGFHNNFFGVQTTSSFHVGDVRSNTFFAKGQYNILNRSYRIYATGKIGFANHNETNQIPTISDGILLEGGLGIMFASRKRAKYFLELSQYTTHASGVLINNDVNALSDIDFDVWFNRIVFTFGIQFGK